MAYLTPEDINLYNTRAAGYRSDYGRTIAKQTYRAGQASLDYGLGKRALTAQWDQTRTALPGSFAGRGLLNSGLYGGALQQYASDRGMAFEGLNNQYQSAVGEINLARGDANAALNKNLNLNEAEKNARRASLASQLRSIT